MVKMNKIYALYHGDEFIDMGSKEHLAKILNVKVRTIEFYLSPTYKKRTNYNGYIVIRVR